jgi:hypothetical protein
MGPKWYWFHRGQRGSLFEISSSKVLQAQQLFLIRSPGMPTLIQLNMYNFHKIRENNS